MNKKIDKDKKRKVHQGAMHRRTKERDSCHCKEVQEERIKVPFGTWSWLPFETLSHRKGDGLARVNTRILGECNSIPKPCFWQGKRIQDKGTATKLLDEHWRDKVMEGET